MPRSPFWEAVGEAKIAHDGKTIQTLDALEGIRRFTGKHVSRFREDHGASIDIFIAC